MTDNEVIQALRICPSMKIIVNPNAGYVITVQDILDLIKRQKAEIERLEAENKKLKSDMSYMINPNTIGGVHEMGAW